MMKKMSTKSFALLFSSVLLLSACSQTAVIQQGENAEVIGDNLHKVDNSGVKSAYVDPDVDFSQYRKVVIAPLDMSQVEIIQPSQSRSYSKWELTDKDRKAFADSYMSQMNKHLVEKSSGEPYQIVDQPGDGVLVISAAVLAIAPSAPKDDISSRGYSGRSRVFSEGAGAMSIAVLVTDGKTEKQLIEFVDNRESLSGVMRRNNSVTNLFDVNYLFSFWARKLKSGLDELSHIADK